ncbi:BON domain-containing protein [Aestuariibacter salexigens]|uniref:BON domain-containing protein n=1 Tax=Aestuariibacter salexigens TaxID=226010 RepID=UPI00041EE3F5|nr:BON domain-containing protein [Aestuariibacter salexigens]
MRRWIAVTAIFSVVMQLQSCAVVAVGAGAAAVVSSANDRRTLGTQVDDTTAETRIAFKLGENEQLKASANIDVEVHNGVALLTGQIPTETLQREAGKIAQTVKGVRKVHNQIRVAEPIGAGPQANDVWLASKVRTQILTDSDISSLHIKVTVQDSEVFLMGLVTEAEAQKAVDIARNINGVARVVKVFEIL